MALYTTLTALSQTAGANPPDGATDAPSTLDDQDRLLGSFSALLRDEAHIYATSVAGTNTITATIPTNPTSYYVGRSYRFVAAGANTGAVTLNFNSIGAKSLLKVGNVALTGGELFASAVYEVVYDGVNFQLVGMYGLKNSLGISTGYQYLPSGLLIQYGTTAGVTNGSGDLTATFPIAFGTVFMAMSCNGDGTAVPGGISSIISSLTTSLTMRMVSGGSAVASQSVRHNWIALGK